MIDVDELIEEILRSYAKTDEMRALLSEEIYGSEPILTSGSRLAASSGYGSGSNSRSKSRKRGPKAPKRIREMRDLPQSPEAQGWSEARLFVEQARMMVDYEDDLPYTPSGYYGYGRDYDYATYADMDNRRLRGYFTWRAQVRRGNVERSAPGFAFVYINELLNGVGVEPGEPAFRAIESFWKTYRELDQTLDHYVPNWLVDYAVCHDLDPKLPRPYVTFGHGEAMAVLVKEQEAVLAQQPQAKKGHRREPHHFGEDPDAEARLLEALNDVSTYKPLSSRLYKDDPEALRSVTAAVFDQLVRYFHNSRHQDLLDSLFGVPYEFPFFLFSYAVVWQDGPHPDCDYELDVACHLSCRNGLWTCRSLDAGDDRSSRLGEMLRATDRLLRDALGFRYHLKDRGEPKYVIKIIEREVEHFLAWRQAQNVRHVEIDLSKLAGIRSAAAVTREALLIDEERDEVAEGPAAGPAATGKTDDAPSSPTEAQEPAADAPNGLTPDELRLIEDLLAGKKPLATSTDLLVDAINEKLFDLVGDTVLEFGNSGEPSLIEDYVEDVRAALA